MIWSWEKLLIPTLLIRLYCGCRSWWLADQFSVWQNCPGDIWDYWAGGQRIRASSEQSTSILFFIERDQVHKGRFARNTNYARRKKKTLSERNDSKKFFQLLNEFRVKSTKDTLVVITLKTFCCFNFPTLMRRAEI